MFQLLLSARRSVRSRHLRALYQDQCQFRHQRFHLSCSRYSSTSIECTSNSASNYKEAETRTSYLDASNGDSTTESFSGNATLKESENLASTKSNDAAAVAPKRRRRSPAKPRATPLTREGTKKWNKMSAEEQASITRMREAVEMEKQAKAHATAERLRISREAKAQRVLKRAEWEAKKALLLQQEIDEKIQRGLTKETIQQQILERKQNRNITRAALRARRTAEYLQAKQENDQSPEAIQRREKSLQKSITRELRQVASGKAAERRAQDELLQSEDHPKEARDYLRWASAVRGRPGAKADKRRINVVSQELANDVLQRLKPSLDRHKGCDIVEINPGVGVWSSTLHNYLKPRTHILLEPDHELYAPLLKPLLDAPDSKYTLVPKNGIVWRHLEEVLTKTHLPFQEAYETGDPRLNEKNDTLLVVASLGSHPRRPYRGFASISQLVLHQLLDSTQSSSLFQRYGRVRMLIWVGDIETLKVLPKAVGHRRKAAVLAEVSCDLTEIASSTCLKSSDIGLARIQATGVIKKMEKAGMKVPEQRQSDMIRQLAMCKSQTEHDALFTKGFLAKLSALEKDYEDGKFTKYLDDIDSPTEDQNDTEDSTRLTPQYSLLRLYRRQYESGNVMPISTQKLIDEQFSIIALHKKYFVSKDEAEREALMKEITSRQDHLQNQIDESDTRIAEKLVHYFDGTQALVLNPPLLVWDRRDTEPLKVHSQEFFPEQEMTLLDVQPKRIWPILRENYPENWETFEFIVSQLMMVARQPVKRGLQSLAPGAYEWLIEHCPSLTDPTQGGSLDPDQLRVRMLTPVMLKEMIEAWMEWPFRPTRYELLARSGSVTFDHTVTGDDDGGALGGMGI